MNEVGERVALGMVGPMASGVWEVREPLVRAGFCEYFMSDLIKREALLRGVPDGRENWQRLGRQLRVEKGYLVLAEDTARRVLGEGRGRVIIDSIRSPHELIYLKDRLIGEGFRVLFIGVDAPLEVRCNLSQERRVGVDPIDLEEFRRLDEYEKTGFMNPFLPDIPGALRLVERVYYHEGDLVDLRQRVERDFMPKLGLSLAV